MNTSLTTIVTSTPLDLAIAGWIHIKSQNSKRTGKEYAKTLADFRKQLQRRGLDLDALDATPQIHYDGISERQIVILTAQEFATSSTTGKKVRPATHNQRLAILSSFYEYAIDKEFLDFNPIKKTETMTVHRYGTSKALPGEVTIEGLAKIDRASLRGKRDYALLSLLLATGKRLSEVAGLQWRDLSISRSGIITVNFPNLKGGKEGDDKLDSETSAVLLDWLQGFYGETLQRIAQEAPLWVSLMPKTYGQPLGKRSISNICEHHFGTGKVHTTRHTWTRNMLDAGAPLPLIQSKLGHNSLGTTGIYAQILKKDENPYAEEIAKRAGIMHITLTTNDPEQRVYRGIAREE